MLRGPGSCWEGNGNVCGVIGVELHTVISSREDGWLHGDLDAILRGGRETSEMGVCQFAEFLMVDCACAGNHHARGCVLGGDVVHEVVPGEGADVLFGAQDGASQRCALERGGVQMVKHELLLVLVDLRHLAQDDFSFPLDGVLGDGRIEQYVGNDLDRLANILLEDLGEVRGLLARGVGVEMATHVLDLQLQLLLGALGSSLEGHVLQEVRSSVVLGRLVTGSRIDPHADGGSLGAGNGLAADAQTVSEGRDVGRWSLQNVVRKGRRCGCCGNCGKRPALLALRSLRHLGQCRSGCHGRWRTPAGSR
mmetsp:Transcript_1750/g.4298  ORF Transcript_1750/g.4298 Transcript_1750/m.4298 type:complete len:308 (-) Transcript_1750:19-942(-)